MNGYITEGNHPKLKIKVFSPEEEKEIDFLIDTGFDGEILLSSLIAEEMNFEPMGMRLVELADGTEKTVFVSIAEVEWHGERKEINVIISGTKAEPLIGTDLMQDSKLRVDFPNSIVKLEKKR